MGRVISFFAIIALIILILVLPVVGSYNKMISMDQKVKSTESNIDTQLQRRSDLISNLVETVKGYATQEKSIFTDIANARTKLGSAQLVSEKVNADTQLENALNRLLIVVERYPDVKTSQNFKELSASLERTENNLVTARQDYNKAVDVYNTTIRKFPASIIAKIFRFKEKPYYKASQGSGDLPKVDFTK